MIFLLTYKLKEKAENLKLSFSNPLLIYLVLKKACYRRDDLQSCLNLFLLSAFYTSYRVGFLGHLFKSVVLDTFPFQWRISFRYKRNWEGNDSNVLYIMKVFFRLMENVPERAIYGSISIFFWMILNSNQKSSSIVTSLMSIQ